MNNKEKLILQLSSSTDKILFRDAKKYLLQESMGYEYNAWKLDLIYEELHQRDIDFDSDLIYESTLDDAFSDVDGLNQLDACLKVEEISEFSRFGSIFGENHKEPFNNNNYFICRVVGQSMIEAQINDNDLLVVEQNVDPADGNIIVADLQNKLYVKRVKVRDGCLWLVSENKLFEPVRITENMNFKCFGVVRYVMRNV